jgi:hypothetical protein
MVSTYEGIFKINTESSTSPSSARKSHSIHAHPPITPTVSTLPKPRTQPSQTASRTETDVTGSQSWTDHQASRSSETSQTRTGSFQRTAARESMFLLTAQPQLQTLCSRTTMSPELTELQSQSPILSTPRYVHLTQILSNKINGPAYLTDPSKPAYCIKADNATTTTVQGNTFSGGCAGVFAKGSTGFNSDSGFTAAAGRAAVGIMALAAGLALVI